MSFCVFIVMKSWVVILDLQLGMVGAPKARSNAKQLAVRQLSVTVPTIPVYVYKWNWNYNNKFKIVTLFEPPQSTLIISANSEKNNHVKKECEL